MENTAIFDSPIGNILLKSDDTHITGLFFLDEGEETAGAKGDSFINPVLRHCMSELTEYFDGSRKDFTVKINNIGTGFRQKTWQELCKIPYGETITYKELAINVGNPNAVRAVGGANHHNNISIIVPCHRVIGSNGKLVGYGGKLWRKEWLIAHEQKFK